VIEDLFTPMHLLLLFVIVFFLFGAKRLPDLGKSLGHGIREFRSGIQGLTDAEPEAIETPVEPPAVEAVSDTPAEAVSDTPVEAVSDTPVENATTAAAPAEASAAAATGEVVAPASDGGVDDASMPPDEVVDPSDVTIVDEPVDASPIEADDATLVDDEAITPVADERAAS
jgi:sec-independent protein translocase protein TatA